MKRALYLILTIAVLVTQACKKDNNTKNPLPGDAIDETPNEPYREWVVYNTTNSLLPNNQVNALAIDKNDIKWAGTANGLVRITGTKFTVFNTDNSPLPSNYITALAVEADGTVWVGTDAGLARYKQSGWSVYKTTNSKLLDNTITCLTHDALNGTTWVGTYGGFNQISKGTNWESFSELEDDMIYALATDNTGALWLGTFNPIGFKGRILKFKDNAYTTIRLHDLGYTSTHPYALTMDKNNKPLAVLTGTAVKAVVRINGNSLEEVDRPETAFGLKVILVEGDKIWVGGKTLNLFGDKQSPNINIPGTDANIQAIAIDSKGRKWLGTIYGGLAVYNDHPAPAL